MNVETKPSNQLSLFTILFWDDGLKEDTIKRAKVTEQEKVIITGWVLQKKMLKWSLRCSVYWRSALGKEQTKLGRESSQTVMQAQKSRGQPGVCK